MYGNSPQILHVKADRSRPQRAICRTLIYPDAFSSLSAGSLWWPHRSCPEAFSGPWSLPFSCGVPVTADVCSRASLSSCPKAGSLFPDTRRGWQIGEKMWIVFIFVPRSNGTGRRCPGPFPHQWQMSLLAASPSLPPSLFLGKPPGR